jgi:hypothetical protein
MPGKVMETLTYIKLQNNEKIMIADKTFLAWRSANIFGLYNLPLIIILLSKLIFSKTIFKLSYNFLTSFLSPAPHPAGLLPTTAFADWEQTWNVLYVPLKISFMA